MHCRFVRLSLKLLRLKRDRRLSTSKVSCSAVLIWESDSSSRFWRSSSSSSLGNEDEDEDDEDAEDCLSISVKRRDRKSVV